MKAYMTGHLNETKFCKGIWLNTITVRLENGDFVTIDRDETSWTVNPDGSYEMEWDGVYQWDGESSNYDLNSTDFHDASIENIEIEDDADGDYRLDISSISFAA